MASFIGYFGGKHYLAKKIIARMPLHRRYTEVLGGAGHVLLAKKPVYHEVFNDRYGLLIDLFRTIQSDHERFVRELQWMPYARKIFEDMKSIDPEDCMMNQFERAIWYFCMNWMSYNCMVGRSFGWSKKKSKASARQVALDNMEKFANRLKRVFIECLDFREILEKYDHDEMLFYCDPPYVGNESKFAVGFTKKDHLELALMLRQIEGKAIVSYADHPFVRRLYHGWNIEAITAVNYSINAALEGHRQRTSKRIELLITNF